MQIIEGGERFTIIRKVGDGYTYDMMMINQEHGSGFYVTAPLQAKHGCLYLTKTIIFKDTFESYKGPGPVWCGRRRLCLYCGSGGRVQHLSGDWASELGSPEQPGHHLT